MAAPKKNRKSPRAQVSLVARYRSPTAFEFVQEECFDLSLGGMFIRSPAPAPAGTLIKLECDVNGTAGKIRGVARVVWLREHSSDNQPAGMGVKFVKLDPGARETIAEVLEQLGTEPDERDTARPPAPASVPTAAPARTSVPTSAPAPASVPASAHAPKSGPASARTSVPAADAAAVGETSQPTRSSRDAASGTGSKSEPASATAAGKPSAPAAAAKAERAQNRPSPRPAAASAKSGRPDKATPVEMPIPAAVAASIASASSDRPARPNVRTSPSGRAARKADPDARQAETVPPTGSGSHSFVFGALALAGAVTLFIVFSTQQSYGPGSAAPRPATAVASQVAEPAAVEAPAPSEAPAPVPSVADEPPAKYVLDIATTPNGARVTAGGRVLTAPGQLDLGALDEPLQLTAESDGFEPAVATIDRVGFMQQEGAMRRRIELTLTERAKAPEPAAAPAPEPAQVAAPAPAPKPTPKTTPAASPAAPHSHRTHEAAKAVADAPVQPAPVASEPPVVTVKPAAPAAAPAPAVPVPVAVVAPVAVAAPVTAPPPAAAPTPVAVSRPVAVAPAAATPVAVAAQAESPPPSPLQIATTCLTKGDNPCVIRALEGKAKSPRELELLIETYRATGDMRKAEASMQVYVDNYPSERRASNYRSVLQRQKGEPAPTP